MYSLTFIVYDYNNRQEEVLLKSATYSECEAFVTDKTKGVFGYEDGDEIYNALHTLHQTHYLIRAKY